MDRYIYRCDKCGEEQEITIEPGPFHRLMSYPQKCKCGGTIRVIRKFRYVSCEPYWDAEGGVNEKVL